MGIFVPSGARRMFTEVRRSTVQNVAHNTSTKVIFNTVVRDDAGLWNAATPDKLTISTAGLWRIEAALEWLNPASANGARILRLHREGSITDNVPVSCDASPNWGTGLSTSRTWNLVVGDTLELRGHQMNSGSTALDLTADKSWLSAEYLGV